MSVVTCLIVALGGAVGTIARYVVSLAAGSFSRDLPLATIGINVLGSFVIGFFGTLTLQHGRFPASENLRLFVMMGFCGGFTTFSSFSLQTLDLLRGGAIWRAGLNVAISVVLCVLAVSAGHMLAAQLNGGRVAIAQVAVEEEG